MAASSTQISNLALGKLGQARIESMSEQSAEARWCNEFYSQALDFVSTDAPWRHNETIVTMEELTNDRSDDWGYKYNRPSDCLKVRYLLARTGAFDPQNPVRYITAGSGIYSDEPTARLVYSQQQTDTTTFPAGFTDALAHYLSHLICQPLTQSDDKTEKALAKYYRAKAIAIQNESSEMSWIKTADEGMADWHAGR